MGWPIQPGGAAALNFGLGRGWPQRSTPLLPLAPTNSAALMAGGIWLTSAGVAGAAWSSQATQANTFVTNATDDPPTLVTPAQGAKYWSLVPGAHTFFPFLYLGAPGSALKSTHKSTLCMWIRLVSTVAQQVQHSFFYWWTGGNTDNRIECWIHDEGAGGVYLSINGSADGTGTDPNDRWKYNGTPRLDWGNWHFLVIEYDEDGTNTTDAGGNFSSRVRVYIDGVLDVGTGFSAGGAPPTGPVRTPLHASSAVLSLGPVTLNQAGNPRFHGHIAHVLMTGGDLSLSATDRARLRLHDPPID